MPLSENNTIEYWGNDCPKCPHCDRSVGIDENELYNLYDDSDIHEVECPFCEKEFEVKSISKWTFSTDEQDEI